jgi:nitrite reductase/ring-hydroxylating ferredoxin subunit
MEFMPIAKLSSLENKEFISLSILGKRIAIFKNPDGSLMVTEAGCKHQGADITQGKRNGDEFTCPRHGWSYNIRTGECLNHDSVKLRKYEHIIDGDIIKIRLGS